MRVFLGCTRFSSGMGKLLLWDQWPSGMSQLLGYVCFWELKSFSSGMHVLLGWVIFWDGWTSGLRELLFSDVWTPGIRNLLECVDVWDAWAGCVNSSSGMSGFQGRVAFWDGWTSRMHELLG